jgi:GNAT superfamily N-acetyltransferase
MIKNPYDSTKQSNRQYKNIQKLIKTLPRKKYEDSDFYKLLRDNLKRNYKNHTHLIVEEQFMGHCMDYLFYENNSCFIGFGGNYLRFGTRGKSIDITRVNVLPEYHRRGYGTILMDTFLLSFYLVIGNIEDKNTIPDIVLECCGGVGYGDTQQETPVESQIKFFQKFGFEIYRKDKYGYTHLKLSPQKFLDYVKNVLCKKIGVRETELV